MQTTQYIAINSPHDFYFVELPTDLKTALPGSSYTFVKLQQFIDRLIEKYPGTLRDLAAAVDTNPQYLFFMGTRGDSIPSRRSTDTERPRPNLLSMVSSDSFSKLIKAYYKYYLNTVIPGE